MFILISLISLIVAIVISAILYYEYRLNCVVKPTSKTVRTKAISGSIFNQVRRDAIITPCSEWNDLYNAVRDHEL